MNIQAGDIILVRGKVPFISRAIRWFTNSEYTHVGIAVTNDFIFEIDIDRRMAIHVNEHEDFDVFRYKHGLTVAQKRQLQKHAIKRAKDSKGYDWFRIVGFALEKFFKGPIVIDRVNREVCSEIVDYLYQDIGIDLAPNRRAGNVRPSDLALSPELIKVNQ